MEGDVDIMPNNEIKRRLEELKIRTNKRSISFSSNHKGEIYYITFPYTLDTKYPNGKSKFVLVLQEGDYFRKYDTVEIMLITSDKQYKPREKICD